MLSKHGELRVMEKFLSRGYSPYEALLGRGAQVRVIVRPQSAAKEEKIESATTDHGP